MLGRLWVLALGLALLVGVQPAAGEAHAPTAEVTIYLPYVRATGGINGQVFLNGVGQSGVPLQLYFYNGSTWSVPATTTSGAYGRYTFAGRPTLLPGQIYVVEYFNTATAANYNNRVAFWDTRQLTTYTANTIEPLGDFDIADIVLTGPLAGAGIGVPRTFTWIARGAVPSDNYAFQLFEPDSGSPYFEVVELGYTNAFELVSQPTGFEIGTTYGWSMMADGPDGDLGAAFWMRFLYFTGNAANSLAASETMTVDVPASEFRAPGMRRPLHDLVAEQAAP